jgi:hypothetical protein
LDIIKALEGGCNKKELKSNDPVIAKKIENPQKPAGKPGSQIG